MPRPLIILSDEYPYHVCARSNNREWFELPLSTVYGIYANVLAETIDKYSIRPQAFVLMSNHFHMLVSTPNANLSQAMRFFMTETSRAIARASNRINRIYGRRYHWTLITTSEHYAHTLMYIYRNPIKAKITVRVEDYPWSTIHPHHQKMNSLMQAKLDGFEEHIPNEKTKLLSWLNQLDDESYSAVVQKALRNRNFKAHIKI